MKHIALALSIILLSGCGVTEQLGKNCGGDLKELCYNVFGGRVDNQQDTEINNLQEQIDQLGGQVSFIKSQMTALSGMLQTQINDLSADQTALESLLNSSQADQDSEIAAMQAQISSASASITSIQNTMTSLQGQSNTATVNIATLMGYKNIADIYDPCGQQGSWNEVFLHLADGHYIASFSDNANGQNTRFTVLQDGSYVTTDGTHCYFTVSGGGTSISGEHN